MTLQQLITSLNNNAITIDSDIAELTRIEYYDQFYNYINTGQYIPILYYNINNASININNTPTNSFTNTDLFTSNDWSVLNQTIFNFTAYTISGNTTITNVSIPLSVGQYISGSGIPNGTTVVSGSSGTYVLSAAPTITITKNYLFATNAYPLVSN